MTLINTYTMKKLYYTYIYRDPSRNNEPIYVGKGKDRRARDHLRRNDHHPFTQRLQFMKRCGIVPNIEIVYALSEEHALFMEVCCIAVIGRKDLGKGPLLNLTNGGDGAGTGGIPWNKGIKRIQETKDKISKKLIGNTPWNKGVKSGPTGKPAWNSGQKMSDECKTRHEKPIHTPRGIFRSLTEASVFYNRTVATVWGRFKLHPADYYYVTREEYEEYKESIK